MTLRTVDDVNPTRIRLLVLIAVVAGVLGWIVATVSDSIIGRFLPVPWSAAIAVWMLAIALAMWVWIVRPRLLRREGTEPLSPFVAARTAALALAASRVGAGVTGVYAGIGIQFISSWSIPAAQASALIAGLTALGGVALAVVALWLERLCRIKDDDDEQSSPTLDVRGLAGGAERTGA